MKTNRLTGLILAAVAAVSIERAAAQPLDLSAYTTGSTGFHTNAIDGVITNGVAQTNEPNRCLGIRQTGSFGDPGASFVIKLANTLLYSGFKMSVDLINLDPTSTRTTTWQIQ